MAGADVAKIMAVLNDATQKLAGKMDDGDYTNLAMFGSRGQVDMSKYIDGAAKMPKGVYQGDRFQGMPELPYL